MCNSSDQVHTYTHTHTNFSLVGLVELPGELGWLIVVSEINISIIIFLNASYQS